MYKRSPRDLEHGGRQRPRPGLRAPRHQTGARSIGLCACSLPSVGPQPDVAGNRVLVGGAMSVGTNTAVQVSHREHHKCPEQRNDDRLPQQTQADRGRQSRRGPPIPHPRRPSPRYESPPRHRLGARPQAAWTTAPSPRGRNATDLGPSPIHHARKGEAAKWRTSSLSPENVSTRSVWSIRDERQNANTWRRRETTSHGFPS